MKYTPFIVAAALYAISLLYPVQAAAQIIAGDLDMSGDVTATDVQLMINAALGIDIDSDDDGLTDIAETMLGLDPLEPDSDGDGQNDLLETLGCQPDDGEQPSDQRTVVINELLAHSDLGEPDWIELYNTTDTPINIGGWFLSDDGDVLQKYEITDPTIIEPYDYIVFLEDVHFRNELDPGCHQPFALSENGETLFLSSGQNGELTDYRKEEAFGPSETGIAFGRYEKSTGTFNFVAMSQNTPGEENAYPKVGPIVITEIMYNPQSGNQDEEYIELQNITDAPVDLFDDEGNVWRFTDGIVFSFPPETTVPAGGYLLVVKDPLAFAAAYNIPQGTTVLGPYLDGQLNNGGEKVEISMPGKLDGSDERQYIRVDSVNYDDEDPWPVGPDGNGESLTRIVPADYGNDVVNWDGAAPGPGE